ncbi:GntR family transcriptional regulator [Sandaracinobacter neustonicus]|nr:GntR family transcriptional regulator [Sandaracinobacter neustonicus]
MPAERADQPVAGSAKSPPEIADVIRRDIQSGAYPPGHHLGTIEIAERFGVSRGPVREALRLLESLNLVRILPRKGAFVIAPGDDEIQELLEIRGLLFALSCERAARRITAEVAADLGRHAKRLTEMAADPACSPRRFQQGTFDLAETVLRACGSERLAEMQREMTFGAGIVYGHLSFATQDMRAIEARAFGTLVELIVAGHPEESFRAARRVHEDGVRRGVELAALMPKPAPTDFRGKRKRRS